MAKRKGQESSCQFDSRPLKVKNLPDLLTFMCLCHILLERSWWRLQLFFRPHINQRSSKKIMGLQTRKIPHFKNFETLNLKVPRQNDIWVQAPWSSTKNIIRGKAVASLKSRLWWVLKIRVCPWLIRAPKVLQLCTNQLVVWVVQVRVNNWLACHFVLVPIPELQHTHVPPKCCEPRSAPQLLILLLFSPFRLTIESIKEFGGAS